MATKPVMCRFVEGITSAQWAYVTNRVRQMRYRCTNPDHPDYRQYGARGIQFRFKCVRTAAQYLLATFTIEDIEKHQVDRIDNQGHYQAGNIRLVTLEQNRRNKRPKLADRMRGDLVDEIRYLRRRVRQLEAGL